MAQDARPSIPLPDHSDSIALSSTLLSGDEQDGDTGSRSKAAMTESTSAKPAIHKRSTSGSLLSRLLFKSSSEQAINSSSTQVEPFPSSGVDDGGDDNAFPHADSTSPTENGESSKTQVIKQRKRKGSLRKVALLGGRRLAGEVRERRNSLLQRGSVKASPSAEAAVGDVDTATPDVVSAEDLILEREHSEVKARHSNFANTSSPSKSSTGQVDEVPAVTSARLALLTAPSSLGTDVHGQNTSKRSFDAAAATMTSPSDPRSSNSYASTTEDDDEGLSFSRPSTSGTSIISSEATYPPQMPAVSATSYFPPAAKPSRPRSQHRVRPSPLQHALAPAPEPYSYAETEYWGWVILFVTWLSFTVGMGSCLDIWSWAWDVGETPYAPPELEDDPTLPIVGYYPALIVLTGVVAWVWITVAWIGMKYFRHAKIEM